MKYDCARASGNLINRITEHDRVHELAAGRAANLTSAAARFYSLLMENGAENAMDELGDAFDAVASYFGVLSEPTRLRIMHSICDAEKTVSQIVAETGATQTNVSRHLGIMQRSGVLTRRKQGNQVYYRTADAAMLELCRGVCQRISARMNEKLPLRRDLLRLMPQAKRAPKRRSV